MTVDFHTHVFPDRVARGAIASLASASGGVAYSDGTVAGLRAAISAAGVTVAVNLPVLTSPMQFESVLAYAEALNREFSASGCGVLSFAGMHPGIPDVRAAMRRVREAGIPGIKIHPEYQSTDFDDDAYYRLLSAAKEEGLITVTHAGVDDAYRGGHVRCTPERVLRMLDRLGGYPRLVLAHLGGHEMHGEVLDRLAGREVYLDTSYVLPRIPRDLLLQTVDRHGASRILFATDSPWRDIAADLEIIRSLGLPEDDLKGILYKNARDLLGLA